MMKLTLTIILTLLTLLAVSSGATKVMLMEQEVEFFGGHGFSNPVLIAYGLLQLIGGALLPFRKTRFVGATIVAITFAVSLVFLVMDGNLPLSIVTAVAMTLLVFVMAHSRRSATSVFPFTDTSDHRET